LVEEYMLLANILIAEHLYNHCKGKTVLRAHPEIAEEKKTALTEFFGKVGLREIELNDNVSLSKTMEALKKREDAKEPKDRDYSKYEVVSRKLLTCFIAAKYLCINDLEPGMYRHFGLNFPLYTHFTSPIRRYADLLVHRLVTFTLLDAEKSRSEIERVNFSDLAE